MIDSIQPQFEAITRSNLLQYMDALNQLYSILGERHSITETSQKLARLQLIRSLLNTLKVLKETSPASIQGKMTHSEKSGIAGILSLSQPLQHCDITTQSWQQHVMNNPNIESLFELITQQLDPKFLVDNQIRIRDSVIDFVFYNIFAKTNTNIEQTIGALGDELLIVEKLLQGTNEVYKGISFNPGMENVNFDIGDVDTGQSSRVVR